MDSSGPHSFTNSIQDMQNDKRRKKEKICIKNMQNNPDTQRFFNYYLLFKLVKKRKKGKGHKKVSKKII